jgi:hypothetical protein
VKAPGARQRGAALTRPPGDNLLEAVVIVALSKSGSFVSPVARASRKPQNQLPEIPSHDSPRLGAGLWCRPRYNNLLLEEAIHARHHDFRSFVFTDRRD